jgi:two-component system sensor histidine kinase KdpD
MRAAVNTPTPDRPGRGRLRIYLGAAPGVGKTYTMLAEGQRRRSRGTDVVIGLVEPHGRRLTVAMTEGLETVPRRSMRHRGAVFTEMDVDAVLARAPQVALVDELAHTNIPGCRNPKRWQDVEQLLAAGIDVVTTLNIQHLESLADVVQQITGVEQRERLPDTVARAAEQVELVDMTPEALRRRMVHGNVYPPDRIEAALTHYFRPGNLTALRELALLWVADRVEEGLERYRADHGIAGPWETRERIAVALAGGPEGEELIRRAARIAARTPGAELLAVHVVAGDGLAACDPGDLTEQRRLVEATCGTWHEVIGDDVATELADFARSHRVTQLVLGDTRGGRLLRLLTGPGIGTAVARRVEHIDVHLVARGAAGGRKRTARGRHGREAVHAEAAARNALAVAALRGGDLPKLLDVVRDLLGLDAISLLEPGAPASSCDQGAPDPAGRPEWFVVASAGDRPPEAPDESAVWLGFEGKVLVGRGKPVTDVGRGVLRACSDQIVAALEGPLWRRVAPPEDAERPASAGLPAAPEEMYLRPVELDEIVAAALDDLGPGHGLGVALPEDIPDVLADAAGLTRALTALAAHALCRSTPGRPPRVEACAGDGTVEITVADLGGPLAQQDVDPEISLARALIGAMGGSMRVDTGAGGTAATIILPSTNGRESSDALRGVRAAGSTGPAVDSAQ